MKSNGFRLGMLFAIWFFHFRLDAQETPLERHHLATNQLQSVAAEMSARCLTEPGSLAEWKTKRPELRQQLLFMLGLDPLPRRTPLNARVTGRLTRDHYRVEKIVFQSLPGLYVTGNFYVPRDAAKPLPTILYLCGHAPHPLGAKVHYQTDGAVWFASHGYACLVLDTLEFGEVPGIHHGTHDLNMWYWLSLGYTPAGVEVWNAMRALDYLETRPEVDAGRFGMTGISGGGAMTWYTAAVDERVAAAAPVCSAYTFGSQAAHWLAAGQCDCIYYHNAYLWDFPVVAALIAPRPLLILSGQRDTIFPPDGYHEVFQRAKRVYDLYPGAGPEHLREVDADIGHSNPPEFHREAHQWMERWLKDESTPLPQESLETPRETAADLACLTGLLADAINYKIQNQFTAPVKLRTFKSRADWEKRRTEVVHELKDKVFRWFPTNNIPFETKVLGNPGGYAAGYADQTEFSFQSEAGARVRARLLTPKQAASDCPLLLYVKRPGDSFYSGAGDELSPLLGRYRVLILNPRFTESRMSDAEYADVERTAAWVGRTIAALQIQDILRAVEWVEVERKMAPASISIYGKGDMGALALYAALFDARIDQVILNDPPGSHWQHPALLNVLRVTDLAEVAGAFAPRRLVSLTELPRQFDLTRSIYRLCGQTGKFERAGSLPEALEVWKYTAATPGRNQEP